MAFLYIILSFIFGLSLCYRFFSLKMNLISGHKIIPCWIFLIPSCWVVGLLCQTWLSYIGIYLYREDSNALLYGNNFSLALVSFFLVVKFFYFYMNKCIKIFDLFSFYHFFKTSSLLKCFWYFLKTNKFHLLVLSFFLVFWSVLMCRSFWETPSFLKLGYSIFSDFYVHVSMAKSFALGHNFPTEYSHFPDGTIRYHFMFMFLAGNLESLGLSTMMSFNFPSILAIISFTMGIYWFAGCFFGSKIVGLLACFLAFLRSSLAFFTYSQPFLSFESWKNALLNNLSVEGTERGHIGFTAFENWGLWAQKVYLNQRHLAFGETILLLCFFYVFPFFYKGITHRQFYLFSLEKGWFFKRKDFLGFLAVGFLLGLCGFWNGSGVIATLVLLATMGLWSSHRFLYAYLAIICLVLVKCQELFFIPHGNSVATLEFFPWFLAHDLPTLKLKMGYYFELLGFLPIILFSYFGAKIKNNIGFCFISLIVSLFVFWILPEKIGVVLGIGFVFLSLSIMYGARFCLQKCSQHHLFLIFSLLSPLLMASLIKLTSDVTINHKYVFISFTLLSIFCAYFVYSLWIHKMKIFSLLLFFILISTGIVDLFTVWKLDYSYISYDKKNPITLWVLENTKPQDAFLGYFHGMHYINMAGRRLFAGWPYFTKSAGYDADQREILTRDIIRGVYSKEEVINLAKKHGFEYIMTDNDLKNSSNFIGLNESYLSLNFKLVFEDGYNGGTKIYKVLEE